MNDCAEAKYNDTQELQHDSQSAYGDSDSKVDDIKVDTHLALPHKVTVKLELSTELKEEQFNIQRPTGSNLKITETTSEKTILNEKLTSNKSLSAKIKSPLQNKIPVRCLKGHYCRAHAILLGTVNSTVSSQSAQKALRVVYSLFQTMEPDLTFQPCTKELRCLGYFTYDFDTCSFVAQIYRVHASVALTEDSTEYIFELRRASINGRESFDYLLSAIAIRLKQTGHAGKYADGSEIYPLLFLNNGVGLGWSSEKCPIQLSTGSSSRLISRVAKQTYPQYGQTLRLLAKCSESSRANREVLSKNRELSEVVFKELTIPSEASACLNALKLVEFGVVAHKEILTGILKSMLVYCAKEPTGFKGLRSQAIENASLGAMKALSETMSMNDKKEAILAIECLTLGKLRNELLRKVHDIFQGIYC